MKEVISVGTQIVLNSGGPVMTVAQTKRDRDSAGNMIYMSYTVWFSVTREPQGQWFDNRCLREPMERDFA